MSFSHFPEHRDWEMGKTSPEGTDMAVVELWFDGACEPTNPGGTGVWGFLVKAPGLDGLAECGTLPAKPDMTNNVAEYTALGKGLRFLVDCTTKPDMPSVPLARDTELVIRGDSKLVIEQLNGTWQCRNERLKTLLARCKELLDQLTANWRAEWVPREENTEADELTRRAYLDATGKPMPERRKKR